MTVTINPRPETTITAEQIEQLRGIPPATIGHMLDFGFMANDLGQSGSSEASPSVDQP